MLTTLWTVAFMVTEGGAKYSREAPLMFLGGCGFKHLDAANALPAAVDGWHYIVVLVTVDEEGAKAPATQVLIWNAEDADDLSASRAVSLVRGASRPVASARGTHQSQDNQHARCCVYFKLEPDDLTRAVMVSHLRRVANA
jgi:hypothetical protein